MKDIIAALQEEIAAAQKKRALLLPEKTYQTFSHSDEYARLGGYIQGLNQALYLLTRETAVTELNY